MKEFYESLISADGKSKLWQLQYFVFRRISTLKFLSCFKRIFIKVSNSISFILVWLTKT